MMALHLSLSHWQVEYNVACMRQEVCEGILRDDGVQHVLPQERALWYAEVGKSL